MSSTASENFFPKNTSAKAAYCLLYTSVFRLCREHPAVKFVLSSDIPRSEVEAHGVFDYISVDPGMDIKLESKFRLKALPSTDLGVAFLCCLDGRNIYHAGDLNLWLRCV